MFNDERERERATNATTGIETRNAELLRQRAEIDRRLDEHQVKINYLLNCFDNRERRLKK